MLPMALRLIGACVLLHFSSSVATPVPLYSSLEGSTDEEVSGNVTSFSSEARTTPAGPTPAETVLSRVVSFLQENTLLVVVSGFFLLLVFLVICGALFMSRRRRVNAYYPSSFPSKMYVDLRDKTGGAKPFTEVPEKAAPEQQQQREPVDSHKQLQADIMRAANRLRTPRKPADAAQGSGSSHKAADHSPEESSDPPEEKGPSEPRTSSSPRPPSLHVLDDSAALQLIAGEKTAF
ncbi:transmembrane protein 119b [Brachionichthys hirsutus]|uniref:transmembrane protein 119b n=1 Tax=Brachionichthys hirsutus TaxID=412623 RepID=UPI003604C1A9